MRTNLFNRLAPLAAVAAFASTASAQLPTNTTNVSANGVSVAGENAQNRAPIFTAAAFTAGAKKAGFGVQAFTDRLSIEEDDAELSVARSVMQVGGYYGLTSRLTVGAYVPFAQLSGKLEGAGADDFDASESGLGDVGVFGRMGLYQSQSGATRFALGAEVTMPTGDEEKGLSLVDPTYRIDGALSHRAGKWNLHIVPGVRMISDLDPIINFNVAGVYALSERMGWSVEALSNFGGAMSDVDEAEGNRDIDVASGIRYRLAGSSALDLGVRYNVATKLEPKPTALGAYVGWNLAF